MNRTAMYDPCTIQVNQEGRHKMLVKDLAVCSILMHRDFGCIWNSLTCFDVFGGLQVHRID